MDVLGLAMHGGIRRLLLTCSVLGKRFLPARHDLSRESC
jgi:hypothetical protein